MSLNSVCFLCSLHLPLLPEEQKSQHEYWEGQELFRDSSEEMSPFPSNNRRNVLNYMKPGRAKMKLLAIDIFLDIIQAS